jgi:hypothetical protein
MIGRNPTDELDVLSWNRRSAWDYFRQNSQNFLFFHRITVSGLTSISSENQSFRILESTDQNRRQLDLNLGFFALRFPELVSEGENPDQDPPG